MNVQKLLLPALLITLAMTGCDNNENKQLILGHWKGVEWKVNSGPSPYDASAVSFRFDDDKTYSYTYDGTEETGSYFISRRELYTTPEGGIRMMVKIQTLNQDSMVFDMNRSGSSETLVLLRQ